ncbi:MAG: flagellar biosynthetic protein FliO [Chlamydiota bacterium]|nr:flagellar biosynthetic protein FliO [Chlamydiota bacterium]
MKKNTYITILLLVLFTFGFSPSQADENTPATEKKPKYFAEEFAEKGEYEETDFWKELTNMFVTLALIVAVLVALTWIMRRMQTSRIMYANDSSTIKVIDHRALSQKTGLYLIQVPGRAVLIADTHAGVTKLADFPIRDGEGSFESYMQTPNE